MIRVLEKLLAAKAICFVKYMLHFILVFAFWIKSCDANPGEICLFDSILIERSTVEVANAKDLQNAIVILQRKGFRDAQSPDEKKRVLDSVHDLIIECATTRMHVPALRFCLPASFDQIVHAVIVSIACQIQFIHPRDALSILKSIASFRNSWFR